MKQNNRSLAIINFPPCGFGNRLLYYYNLRQEATERECDFVCVPWEGHQIFEGNLLGNFDSKQTYEVMDFCLGDKFYNYNRLLTREVFRLRNTPSISNNTCAIHFRGTDFHAWNSDSILDSQYYLDSISKVNDAVFQYILFTDDTNLQSYKEVINFLGELGVPFSFGENTSDRRNYLNDFSVMSECDWIISSPSTFCICAGMVGKEKRIIHSKKWVENRKSKNDKFWTELSNGGNNNYKLWELI